MNPLEKQLLRQEVGDAEPLLTLCTQTRIDAGLWWRQTPVWLCIFEDCLVLLAVARRRYIEKIALADCQGTHYSPSTGQLVIEPGEALRLSRLAMSPRDALTVLRLLNSNRPTLITNH